MPRTLATLLLVLAFVPTSAVGARDVNFERDVWPILESRCVECHGPPRTDSKGRRRGPKAGLRLDGKGFLLAGSETTRHIWVPGKPEDSLLHKLISLPADDLDIMPSKGEPLTPAQVKIIATWIREGADFGDWTGVAGGSPSAASEKLERARGGLEVSQIESLALLGRLGKDLKPLPEVKRTGLCDGLARVEPVFPGSPLLRVSFTARGQQLTDAHLAALRSIGTHIARLDLARTRIGDAGLRSLGKLPRLVQLNLRGTQVTDAGIARLEAHPELRSLVLHGTVVSDASVEILGSFPRLTDLYVWQTRISPGGVERIRSARPGINVREAPVFPESRPEGRDGRRRRRN